MTLRIQNREIEHLVEELVKITGETQDEAVLKALEERHQRIAVQQSRQIDEQRLMAFLEREVWARIPSELIGTRLTKEEEEQILGFGSNGI